MKEQLIKKLEEYNWLNDKNEYSLVSCEDFFEDNDIKGSFAANSCTENYDINEFRRDFCALLKRDDVENIWINLYSYEEETGWPDSDTAFISTSLDENFFENFFGEAFPSEISENEKHEVFGKVKNGYKIYRLWWD